MKIKLKELKKLIQEELSNNMKLTDIRSKILLNEVSLSEKANVSLISRMITQIKTNNNGWNIDVAKSGTGFTVSGEINGGFFKNNILNFHYGNKFEVQIKLSDIKSISDSDMNTETVDWLIELNSGIKITVYNNK